MFPLLTKDFPASAAELEELLNASLDRVLISRAKPVRVTDRKYPELEEIAITLDGAEVRSALPRPSKIAPTNSPALQVERLQLSGQGISLGSAKINLRLDAREVRFDRSEDSDGKIVLNLQAVANGQVEFSAEKADLEMLIQEIARREGSKHGVSVEAVKLILKQSGERAIEAEIEIKARKMVFGTKVRISGKAEISDDLELKLSGLVCNGEGAIGSLACGFVSPQLQKLEGQSIPLAAFSLGELRLRDINLQVGDQIKVTAVC